MEPPNDGEPDEALLNPRPGAHEELVMIVQFSVSEFWNLPASHWLTQQSSSLMKLPGSVQGEDVVADPKLRPQPKELHETTCKLYGVVLASETLIVDVV